MENVNKRIESQIMGLPKNTRIILEHLDHVARLRIGEKLGTSCIFELMSLCAIFAIDGMLEYEMPASAKAFFISLINREKGNEYMHDHGILPGGMLASYASLRQYIIDNSDRVNKAYGVLEQMTAGIE